MPEASAAAEIGKHVLDEAVHRLTSHAGHQTDGRWLEELTADIASTIRAWNVDQCWRWQDWPDRDDVLPGSTPADLGIDLVARRSDDRRWIAIQAKSRQLDEHGDGQPIRAEEIDAFLAASSNPIWAERWVVVNGAVSLGGNATDKVVMSGAPIKVLNIAQAVEAQRSATEDDEETPCSHCEPEAGKTISQSRSCMQREAVTMSVQRLRENEMSDEAGIPRGEARGRIVLPCGTGKTRIALRITEALTYSGELSVVLCPSIALVAQIRREFLQHTRQRLRTMAVCSDPGVADPDAAEERVANTDDITLDRGLSSTDEIAGCPVTTDADEIADWIRQRSNAAGSGTVSVIFCTYQSAKRVSEGIALANAADAFKVLVCDEAHRTAGVRRPKPRSAAERRLSEFTLCHDRDAFPATYRIYQTATPRIYGDNAATEKAGKSGYLIRHMDDQSTFGVELYRRSYADAVHNGWLADYRIIAMAVGGQEATDIANELVREADERAASDAEKAAASEQKPQNRMRSSERLPATGDYLKGMAFALAMGGATRDRDGERVPVMSCIGFLNTIARSKAMTRVLQSDSVRTWVARQAGGSPADYLLEHLDASSSVAKRDEAKRRLAAADPENPHAVLNVGIFGEGTDSPSLSAVAFLEPRKSPIDVVQAVGRAMRTAPGKQTGYIVVPVVIPPGVDAERHLAVSDKHEGWRELGEILQALRAHDKRIEDALPEILHIHLPDDPQLELPLITAVAVGRPDKAHLEYVTVSGSRDFAEDTARRAVEESRPLLECPNTQPFDESQWAEPSDEPTEMLVHVKRSDGSTETRVDSPARRATKLAQALGRVNAQQTKRRAVRVARGERGRVLPTPEERARLRAERAASRRAAYEQHVHSRLIELTEHEGLSISANLLEKSGLTGNRVQRDLNLLENAVSEAARYIHEEEGLAAVLDEHFGIDRLDNKKRRADGATTASLLWMNAAMLHQRVHAGGWIRLQSIDPLSDVRSSAKPERAFARSWQAITRQDFLPVIEPASEALDAAVDTDRLGGLRRALRHLAGEAEQIAETYADMGTDHAGALFNKVMGDQASDGAFFTRPVAATIAARLALDAVDRGNELDWSEPSVWRHHKTVDLACGSGTLLAAVMSEMKRRARLHGADVEQLADLQKVAVEEVLKGLDINSVSLQLAATQLMSGNVDIKYRKMGLHHMPYGGQVDGTVAAGTLELLARSEIVDSGRLFDDAAASTTLPIGIEDPIEGPQMDDAAEAACNARIVIVNPPFTNRHKCGEKFSKASQDALRERIDTLERLLVASEPSLDRVLEKNSVQPMFETLAGLCLSKDNGSVLAMIAPTIIATASSADLQRIWTAERFHVHTILTCHDPSQPNLSQDTAINESVFVFQRLDGERPPTRIIALDRLPHDEADIESLFSELDEVETGPLGEGWGCVSLWPAERIAEGNWSAVAWRNPVLAEAAAAIAGREALMPLSAPPQGSWSTRQGRDSTGNTNGMASTRTAHDTENYVRAVPQDTSGGRGEAEVKVYATGQAMRDDYKKRVH